MGRSFHGSTEAFSLWQPGTVPADLQKYGVFLGFEQVTNRLVYFWPAGISPDANLIKVLGLRGGGKTTFMKTLGTRLPVLQAYDVNLQLETFRLRFNSRKPNQGQDEYALVLDALQADSYDLSKGGGFNLFTLFRTEAELSVYAVYLGKHLGGGTIMPDVKIAIMAGVHKMLKDTTRTPHQNYLEEILRTLSYDDFNAFYEDDNRRVRQVVEKEAAEFPDTLENIAMTPSDLRDFRPESDDSGSIDASEKQRFEARHLAAARHAADLFLELSRGYGGAFNGNRSLESLLMGDTVGLNWYNLADGAGEIIEPTIMKAEANSLVYDKSSGSLDLTKILPHATLGDETGEANDSEFHTVIKAQRVNKIRMMPNVLIEAQQYTIQGTLAGAEGSPHRKAAMEIENGIGAYVIFRQPDDQETRNYFLDKRMAEPMVNLLHTMQTGQAVIYVPGEPPVRFNHQVLPSEWPLIQTTEAREQLNTFVPLSEMDEWKRRTNIQPAAPAVLTEIEQGEREWGPRQVTGANR